jgi:hypothetical protein
MVTGAPCQGRTCAHDSRCRCRHGRGVHHGYNDRIKEILVATKSKQVARKSRSGPRAPDGKAPLQIIIKQQTIEDAKIAAIRNKTSVSKVVEELLDGWLAGAYKLKP